MLESSLRSQSSLWVQSQTILNKIPKIVQNFWILVESGVSFEHS
jgi:hypothetical protein